EDEEVIAFLDIKPLSKGHVLVLPKKHFENIYDIPEDLLCKINVVAKKLAIRLKEKLSPDGIVLNQNNGIRAGQTIFHYHIHIKPVYEDTPIFEEGEHRKNVNKDEMDSLLNILIGKEVI
ncbi:HIT domain-containing protein, partial [Candidatus Microgenomates bacterium]|nr:HIT domain-containing protein [Candidatus Microgenomates bacterium]